MHKIKRKNVTNKTKYDPRDRTFTGVVHGNERGFAFITPDDGGKDFFVPRRAVCGAFDGDKVLAAHVKGTDDEAYIIKILERNKSAVVGTYAREFNRAYVFPDDTRKPTVYIPAAFAGGAKGGEKVVCEITSYRKDKSPAGRVIEILGEEGDVLAEEASIIRAYGLEEEFPVGVLIEAEDVSREKVTLGKRRDFRNKLIITIDGADTRDIDDGVSLEREGENFVLGVHIADVSHYVKLGTELDKNAYSRGTSVYFPDRVLPMLPKELSNGACSLNEGEDRYAMSCVMTFTPDGERLSYDMRVRYMQRAPHDLRGNYGGMRKRPRNMREIRRFSRRLRGYENALPCAGKTAREARVRYARRERSAYIRGRKGRNSHTVRRTHHFRKNDRAVYDFGERSRGGIFTEKVRALPLPRSRKPRGGKSGYVLRVPARPRH